MDKTFIVRVSCMTFNHAPYIKDAMNGFCMQETTFPFVCTIIDDASTDGEPEVIMKYLQEHFDLADKLVMRNEETDDYVMTFAQHKTNKNCYFAVYYLKYNHYSIKKSKKPYIQEWQDQVKYIAICEGDDYWIDLLKLQKQVDFMEVHPDYTMVCNRTKLYSEKRQQFVGENYCYNNSQKVEIRDVVCKGGLYISTCSIVYRLEIFNDYPNYCKECKVGDYPLQIMAAMKGTIYYFNEIMSVYRVDNSHSWRGRQIWSASNVENRISTIRSQINMFKGFSKDYPLYKIYFENKVAHQINYCVPRRSTEKVIFNQYIKAFENESSHFSFLWKINFYIIKYRIPYVKALIFKFMYSNYTQNILYY